MDECVSKYIVGTCRQSAKSYTTVFESMDLQDIELSEMELSEMELSEMQLFNKKYMIACGSTAEFLIRPLHCCIEDVDFFLMDKNSLAFTNENPVLPYDFRHTDKPIQCFLIEPYRDYPAFLRLRRLEEIEYNSECKAHEFTPVDLQTIAKTTELEDNFENDEGLKVGPAFRSKLSDITLNLTDLVECIWCPQWPMAAKHWPNRRRQYGWPTTSIIHEVIQNGCHVVFAKHPVCRDDVHQCRLSFSVAEVILLQSWTKIQQIVYHMLRFFAKRELIKKACQKEDEVLCTYHFKTLMLWTCEEMSPEWWTSSSVIQLCCKLLRRMLDCLMGKRCPNYFIPQANLFHEHLNRTLVDETVNKLIFFSDSNTLSLWFVEHYMQPSFFDAFEDKCTDDVFSAEYMLQTCKTMEKIYRKSLDIYVLLRRMTNIDEREYRFDIGCFDTFKYTVRAFSPFNDFHNFKDFFPSVEYESCSRFYDLMLRSLYASQIVEENEFYSEMFYKAIRSILIKPKWFISFHRNLPKQLDNEFNDSQICFMRVQNLMENLTGSNYLELHIVSEIATRLLRKALECDYSMTTKIFTQLILFAIAALHFSASEYDIVINICLKVIMNERSKEDTTEPLNAGCFLFIDEISKIVGFYLIFRKVRDASLHYTRRPFFLDLRLTPEVFAHYLAITSIERSEKSFCFRTTDIFPLFPLDVILTAITNRKYKRCNRLLVYQRIDSMNLDILDVLGEKSFQPEENLLHLLIEYALENMTLFYDAIRKDFGIHCNTFDCYRAAYLYKCRRYD